MSIDPYRAQMAALYARREEVVAAHGRQNPLVEQLDEAMRAVRSAARADAEWAKKVRTLLGAECFICFLDIEGFRARIEQDPATLYDQYLQLRQYQLASFFGVTAVTRGGELELSHLDRLLWPYAFSDSWFFTSVDDSEESLRKISTAAAGVFARFMEIGLVARGGIARGRTWWNPQEQIVLGPSVTDAYLCAQSYDGFGVIVHPEIAATAPDDALTPGLEVHVRPDDPGAELVPASRRFARLYAYVDNSRYGTTGYRRKFRHLMTAYESSADAQPHVVERYRRSLPVVDAILEPMDDEPGLPGGGD